MQESILQIRCMGLEYIASEMGIGMKGLGMKVEDKALECILLGMGKHNLVTGRMGFSMFRARRTLLPLYLLWLFIIPKF